jgi:ubiquinone/menaquinone biosynthesis C-methylase UbiE
MKQRTLNQDKVASVYDTEILPIWSARFGKLLLKQARVPAKGLVLNVACGTGYPALDLLDRMVGGRIIAIDSSSALLDVARTKADAASGKRIFFRTEGGKEKLSFDQDVYDLTFTNLGLGELAIPPAQAIAELARVTAPDGQVLITLPLRGTWNEFLDIYREVLTKQDRHEIIEALDAYVDTLPEPETAIQWMEKAGLTGVDLVVEEFSLLFKSSREFFFAPVIEYGPLKDWKHVAGKGQEMQDIFWFIKEAIDAYFGGRAFSVTVVAGCLSGIKPETPPEPEPLPDLPTETLDVMVTNPHLGKTVDDLDLAVSKVQDDLEDPEDSGIQLVPDDLVAYDEEDDDLGPDDDEETTGVSGPEDPTVKPSRDMRLTPPDGDDVDH